MVIAGGEGRRVFDSPFFGARVFIPMAAAGVLAGLLNGLLRPAWYWAIAIAVLCVVGVFGPIIWWESREPRDAPRDAPRDVPP